MAPSTLHAKVIERKVSNDLSIVRFEIRDDVLGVLGEVEIFDGPLPGMKQALQKEANRLQQLVVGTVIDL